MSGSRNLVVRFSRQRAPGKFKRRLVRLHLPVVLVGMAVFPLFQRREFHSRVVNAVAGSAFAVYLITDYQPSQKLLWQGGRWGPPLETVTTPHIPRRRWRRGEPTGASAATRASCGVETVANGRSGGRFAGCSRRPGACNWKQASRTSSAAGSRGLHGAAPWSRLPPHMHDEPATNRRPRGLRCVV